MGKVKRRWQDTEYVLFYFASGRVRRKNYLKYVEAGIKLGSRPELMGGGLVTSLGGWPEVLTLIKKKEKYIYDSRILGDSEFIGKVRSELDALAKKNLRLSAQRTGREELSEKVCKKHGISISELCSGSRRRVVADARRALSWMGVCELGYSCAEVARYLGVTNSCITRLYHQARGRILMGLWKKGKMPYIPLSLQKDGGQAREK